MTLNSDTLTDRVFVQGRFAFLAANDQVSRYRTVRVYDLETPERGLPDGSHLKGKFVTSFYLSRLLARNLTPDRESALTLRDGLTVPAEDWPALVTWLGVMAR